MQLQQDFLDSAANDGYRMELLTFQYGDGHLSASDLDSGSTPEPTKFYYSFLSSFANGEALKTSDPNRLVRETRVLDPGETYSGTPIEYDKQYFYGPGGNRLARVERNTDGSLSAVTRYNYFYEIVTDGLSAYPGTPDNSSGESPWLDYAGSGRDKLLSWQTFSQFDAQGNADKVVSVTCCWEFSHHSVAAENRLTWQRGQSGWDKQLEEVTEYTYNGSCGCGAEPLPGTDSRLMQVHYGWTDYVNLDQNGDPTMGAVGEYSVYDDLLGRRIATYRCSAQGTTSVPYGDCKGETVQYDYYGLSQRVAVVRESPFWWTGGSGGHWIHSNDQFIASFTYGPLGATIRTDWFPPSSF